MTTKSLVKTPPKLAQQLAPVGERTLTVREVAELDRCSEKTVRRAIDAGLLEALRIGPGARLLRVTLRAHAAYRELTKSGL
jgi:excisionase family DNA binding protein